MRWILLFPQKEIVSNSTEKLPCTISILLGSVYYMDQSLTWISLIYRSLLHRSVSYMDQSHIQISLLDGSVSYTDQSYIRISLLHGSVSYTDQSHIRISLIYRSVSYMNHSHIWIIIWHGSDFYHTVSSIDPFLAWISLAIPCLDLIIWISVWIRHVACLAVFIQARPACVTVTHQWLWQLHTSCVNNRIIIRSADQSLFIRILLDRKNF